MCAIFFDFGIGCCYILEILKGEILLKGKGPVYLLNDNYDLIYLAAIFWRT